MLVFRLALAARKRASAKETEFSRSRSKSYNAKFRSGRPLGPGSIGDFLPIRVSFFCFVVVRSLSSFSPERACCTHIYSTDTCCLTPHPTRTRRVRPPLGVSGLNMPGLLCPDKRLQDTRLHNAVTTGDLRGAGRSIDDGARVNGVPELKCLPLGERTDV